MNKNKESLQKIINQITTTNYINKTDLQADIDKYIDILITGLEKLNHQLNNTDIAPGINELRKLRDSIIEIILTDKKILECIYHYVNHYKLIYNSSEGLIDLEEIVFNVVRDLLKKLDFKGEKIRTPKGFLIAHLFKKRTYNLGAINVSYLDSYFNRAMSKIKIKEYLVFDKMLDTQISDLSDLPEEEAIYYHDYKDLSDEESDYLRSTCNQFFNEYLEEIPEKVTEDYIKDLTEDDIGNILDTDFEDELIYNNCSATDIDCFDHDGKPCSKVDYIDKYSVDYGNYKLKYFYDLNIANDLYKKAFKNKLHKWKIYRDNDADFIHHIKGNFESKKIDIEHKVKDLDFENIFKDKRTDKYLKQLILKKLSKRDIMPPLVKTIF